MKRILVVDDSRTMREMIEFVLKGKYQVDLSVDPLDALLKLNRNNYDLVITDVNMPNMDGLTFVREFRNLPKYTGKPILVLTTESDNEKKMKAKGYGATGWIVKPFDPSKLLSTVEKII